MSLFKIETICNSEELNFNNKLFLWILHADKIPPHLAISINDKYFSLKINGKDLLNVNSILSVIEKKSIPTLLVELCHFDNIETKFNETIRKYSSVNESVTCISPINEILFEKNNNKIILPELLQKLNEENKIKCYFGMNLKKYNDFSISYNFEDVNNRVKLLLNK